MDSTQNYPHTSCAKLGTGDASKTDEFSEMFQEGERGGHLQSKENMLQISDL